MILTVVADGAGSAPRGGAGAALACRVLCATVEDTLAVRPLDAIDETAVGEWIHRARAAIVEAAGTRALAARAFATTALLALSDGARTLTAHVGDGAAVARTGGAWTMLSSPARGAHAGTTHFLTDDGPEPRVGLTDHPVSALAILTDGLERLVIDLAACAPHGPFFDMVAAPLETAASQGARGRDRTLSAALGRYLDGEAVCERTDDDKTLALAVKVETQP